MKSAGSTWELGASERERLELFRERAAELMDHCGFPPPFGGRIDFSSGTVEASAVLPAESDLRSAAMAARLFVQDSEPTHIPGVCNLLHRSCRDDAGRSRVAEIRKNFLSNLRRSCYVKVGDLETHEDLLRAMLNGAYFHSDPKLRPKAKQLDTDIGILGKQLFALALVEVRGSVEALLALVEEALGLESPWTPGLAYVRTVLRSRGVADVETRIADVREGTDVETRGMVMVAVDHHFSAKELDELHMQVILVLRDAYPNRTWFTLLTRDTKGGWAQPIGVSPYPRFP